MKHPGSLVALALAFTGGGAFAQEAVTLPTAPIEAPITLPRGALFISPMGQPVRAAANEEAEAPILTWFADADADSDAKLSGVEFIDQSMRFFAALDANHDGQATSSESTTLWRSEAPEMLTGEGARPAPQPRRRRRTEPTGNDNRIAIPSPGPLLHREPRSAMERFGITNDREPVMSCDVDLSRRVTEDEFRACAERRFAALDANRDGFFEIAESERAQALAAR
jgi:hypothetical protein